MKNILPAKLFSDALREINALGYPKHAMALQSCNIVEKPWWMPWKHLSTTIGNTIYISKEWPKWNLIPHLAHEATHLLQQEQIGAAAFLTSYAQKAGRLRLELEAYGVEYKIYRRMYGANPYEVINMQNAILYVLSESYSFGEWFNDERKKEVMQYLEGLNAVL